MGQGFRTTVAEAHAVRAITGRLRGARGTALIDAGRVARWLGSTRGISTRRVTIGVHRAHRDDACRQHGEHHHQC